MSWFFILDLSQDSFIEHSGQTETKSCYDKFHKIEKLPHSFIRKFVYDFYIKWR